MKAFSISLMFIYVASCTSCFKEYKDSLLEKEYDVVMGILAPDSATDFKRTYKTEVFVGKMIPVNHGDIFHITGAEDPVLHELLLATRQLYFCKYEFDDEAEVSIDGEDQHVTLTSVGNGIYRDVNDELKIKSLKKYNLKVRNGNGKEAFAETTVLRDIKFISPIEEVIYKIPNLDTAFVEVENSDNQFYFTLIDQRSNIIGTILSHYSFQKFFTLGLFFTKSFTDNTPIDSVQIRLEMRAVNKDYGAFNAPYGDYGVTQEFFQFEKTLYDGDVARKSNVKGDGIVGVFGSYNATIKEFIAVALWDSVKKNQMKAKQ
ncbi:hypothetical protein K1X84_03830 [bacterium]|nr:hypothetical protein [bacterium]